MTNLSRRLRKLESRLTDASRLIPHSEEWFDCWMEKVDEVIQRGNPDLTGMPLAVIDSLIAGTPQDEAGDQTIDDFDGGPFGVQMMAGDSR
jgi:hypothetical protein